jgi:hypothetical protein
LDVERLISHSVPLEMAGKAIGDLRDRVGDPLKVQVVP